MRTLTDNSLRKGAVLPGTEVVIGPELHGNLIALVGLADRYVTDWAGSGSMVHGINVKLGAPARVGERMLLTGTVTGRRGERVTVEVRGTVAGGEHLRGVVRLSLPE